MDGVPKNPPQMIGDFLPSSFEGVNPTKAITTMKSERLLGYLAISLDERSLSHLFLDQLKNGFLILLYV